MQENNLLSKYNEREVNLLVPTAELQQIGQWHICRISEVHADTSRYSSDVVKIGDRPDENDDTSKEDLFLLAKPLLMRISAAAGMRWDKASGVTHIERDYVCYKAIGEVRLPDGTWQPIVGTKEIDLVVIREEIYENLLRKARKYAESEEEELRERLSGLSPEDWAKSRTDSMMLKWRKDKVAFAETGAMLRVIRAAFGMKQKYSLEELKRPFIVPRIDFRPDISNPEVKEDIINSGMEATQKLYGTALQKDETKVSRPAIVASDNEDKVNPDVENAGEGKEPSQDQSVGTDTSCTPSNTKVKEKEKEKVPEKPKQVEDTKQKNDVPKDDRKAQRNATPTADKKEGNNQAPKADNNCKTCSKTVSAGVRSHSLKEFNVVLCMDCQDKVRAKKNNKNRGGTAK